MSDRFPRVGRVSYGYAVRQVDAYLARVEGSLEAPDGSPRTTAAAIRRTAFDLVLHGYQPMAVDRVLDRLEERALELERVARDGAPVGHDLLAEAAALRARIAQPPGHRFRKTGPVTRGYRQADVDALLDMLEGSLSGEAEDAVVGPDTVRESVFRPRRGGYDEDDVDDYLDRVVDLLLRRRTPAGG
jgi:DivIVA domain-containing protein